MERSIPMQETLTVEFKSDLKKYSNSDLFDDIVAFANTEGGDLYLGVENDGTVTGVHEDHKNPVMLSAYIANNTVPPISVRAEMIDDEKPVLKISVPKSTGGIRATGAGKILRRRLKPDGSPENIPMYPTEIATRLSDLRLLDYSAMMVVEATEEDIDPLELERLRRIVLAYDGEKALLELDNHELLRALGLVREQNGVSYPTVAGLLMLGKVQSLQRFVPTHKTAFQVLEGTTVRVNDEFALPVLASIEKLIGYLDVWNPEQEIEIGLFRMAAAEFHKRALREGIVNAFSHRDYSRMGRVRVAIADEGVTIASPGGFIEGVTVETLLTAEPHGRNQLLADALKRVGLAEKTGRGIDRIYEGSLIYGRSLPDYSGSTDVLVSLFIPRSKADAALTKLIAQEQSRLGRPLTLNTLLVLNLLRDMPRSDVQQISDALKLPESMVKTILEKAVETGLAEAYGSGRGRAYTLSHRMYQEQASELGYLRQKDIEEARFFELTLNLARSRDFISRKDVVELLHVKESKAYSILKALADRGDLIAINKGRYAKYQYNPARGEDKPEQQ